MILAGVAGFTIRKIHHPENASDMYDSVVDFLERRISFYLLAKKLAI